MKKKNTIEKWGNIVGFDSEKKTVESKSELKPCPFCGSEVELKADNDNLVLFFTCKKGSSCTSSGLFISTIIEERYKAIKQWNTRI